MKTTLFTTVGAIALTSLALTLAPSTLSAHQSSGGHNSGRGGHSSGRGGHCSPHGHGSSHCSRLPHGCRPARYRGERCWYGGGRYYRCAPSGGYICIEQQPEVEYQEAVVQTQVEEPAYEEDSEEVVSYLPESCETVYIGGERCWFHNGCYYRHCGRGYSKFHCRDHGRGGRTCKSNRGSRYHGQRCSTNSRGHNSGRGRSSGHSGHSSSHGSHSSGHSSGHGRR